MFKKKHIELLLLPLPLIACFVCAICRFVLLFTNAADVDFLTLQLSISSFLPIAIVCCVQNNYGGFGASCRCCDGCCRLW